MITASAIALVMSSMSQTSPRVFATLGTYQVRADDLWIIATAIACSVSCGLLGCFLVLRRMSLLGDAISHAILPGLAIAFIVTHSRDPMSMLAGAMVVGLLTAFLSTGLTKWGKVPEDASMGVVFTTLFAIGVLLITWVARDVDLDPGCVLYGLIEFSPFDTVHVFGQDLPRSFVWLAVMLCLNTTLIFVFFKELKIVCFDPYLATTMGISATVVHYMLMTAVAATSVASFESVGSILVVAMLVAPGATAHLLTDKLNRMLWLAALIAAVSAVFGYIGAVWLNTSVAGMIATVSLIMFVLTALFAPRHGFVSKQLRQLSLSMRINEEDVLGMAYRWHESSRQRPVGAFRALEIGDVIAGTRSGLLARVAVWLLKRRGHIAVDAKGGIAATEEGIKIASHVVRGHRLWETYLAKHLEKDLRSVHAGAHRAEHFLSQDIQDRLDAQDPSSVDPHGKPIPRRE